MDEEYWKITESLKLIKIEKENKERSTVTKDYINHLSTNVNLMREGQRFGEKKKLAEIMKVIDEELDSKKSKEIIDKLLEEKGIPKEFAFQEKYFYTMIDEINKELKIRLTGGRSNG